MSKQTTFEVASNKFNFLVKLKTIVLVSSLILSTLNVFADDRFPVGPNPELTPGSLCQNSPVKRYPEGITYCERNVSTGLKKQLIKEYDQELGFEIQQMNRQDFKIDHFIPLSIGGSNNPDNLWPQHKSVYSVTDQLEQKLSDKISAGQISQSEAVRIVREGKLNLDRVPELMDYLEKLH